MKKNIQSSILIISALLLQGCCWIFGVDCDQCQDVQMGTELADLLLASFESDLKETNDGETAYNVVHTVLNFAGDFECPEEVSESISHQDQLKLVYSENEEFNTSEVVDTKNVSINQMTGPSEDYRVVNELVFSKAGFYILDNSIDNTNVVKERNENNNNDINTLTGKGASPALSRIIHITDDMITISAKNKNNKYISRWEVHVEYE